MAMNAKIMGADKMMMGMSPAIGMGMPMQAGQMNMMMMPRCTMKMEKYADGMRLIMSGKDETATAMMQNLCSMMTGSMTSMSMMMNGMTMMDCNLIVGMCKFEMMDNGMRMIWTSKDDMVSKMIQSCCDTMSMMMECGSTAVVCMNNTPICCS